MLVLCKEIVVFLLLAKILEGFEAGKKYGKFVRLIISLIVVLQILNPVVTFLNKDFEMIDIAREIEKRFEISEWSNDFEAKEAVTENVKAIETIEISGEVIQWE